MNKFKRWREFSDDELFRLMCMLEYYAVQDDLTFDLLDEVKTEMKRRETFK